MPIIFHGTGSGGSAKKLKTARTINGTNFDGTANITTANWGTTRTVTVGNTSKSVNGSGNVSWSLAEIGIHLSTTEPAASDGKNGDMLECPDYLEVDGYPVIICSPQNMHAQKYEFHNGHNSIYIIGDAEKEISDFAWEKKRSLDYGLDFYAPQTTELPDGRRIMVAWMKSWDACVVPDSQDWQGMMTLPRELEIKDGRIWQKPVKEIENYRANKCHYTDKKIDCYTTFDGIKGRTFDMTVELSGEEYNNFTVEMACDDEYGTVFTYNRVAGMLEIDRTCCGVTKDVVCVRKIKIADTDRKLKLRFIVDRQSIELFINDGQQVATTAICTPLQADGICFNCDGSAVVDIEKYDIIL